MFQQMLFIDCQPKQLNVDDMRLTPVFSGGQVPTSQAPPGRPPPIQHKPQDETERRIMEILSKTANIQRGQVPTTTAAVTTALPTVGVFT